MSAYKTIFGYRVWPASILKVYYPFMLSATTIYFLFSSTDKWANLVKDVQAQANIQKEKTAAAEYLASHVRKALNFRIG
ncbi:hypothetical protein DFJ73DRAFT_776259 [Zopfochytrium polystomum]|nr:hypothetical protein DFJ73DRAFT_776259 [Zopfochytrium polystomum]